MNLYIFTDIDGWEFLKFSINILSTYFNVVLIKARDGIGESLISTIL